MYVMHKQCLTINSVFFIENNRRSILVLKFNKRSKINCSPDGLECRLIFRGLWTYISKVSDFYIYSL